MSKREFTTSLIGRKVMHGRDWEPDQLRPGVVVGAYLNEDRYPTFVVEFEDGSMDGETYDTMMKLVPEDEAQSR